MGVAKQVFRHASRLCFSILVMTGSIDLACAEASAQSSREQGTFNVEALKAYDGFGISKIQIEGLRWTHETAARYLLSLHEGDVFGASRWLIGIHKLYDTGVLYEIETDAKADEALHTVSLTVRLKDRWTLLPYAFAQSGGGSSSLVAGVFDTNLFGNFLQGFIGYGTFDNVGAYEINLFQEFFRDTNFIWGLDFQQGGTPVQMQFNDGTVAGSFTRFRTQEQVLIGRKWPEQKIRLLTYVETFSDQILGTPKGSPVSLYSGLQYRVRPTLIVGRAELTNFLEQGQEVTFMPSFANLADSSKSITQMVATLKRVFLHDDTNYAVFFNLGFMTPTEIPYQFRLGGFDTIRGFSTNRAIGRQYAANSLEFRPYLFRLETGLVGPVVAQGCVFQDVGFMHEANSFTGSGLPQKTDLTLLSEGVGFRLNFLSFASAILRVDAAKAVIPNEGWDFSVATGQFF